MTTAVRRSVDDGAHILFEKIGYDPTQGGLNVHQPAIIDAIAKYILIVGGEQGGKSLILAMRFLKNWVIDRVKHPKFGDGMGPPLLYWLIAASYGETIKEFTYIADALIEIFGEGAVKFSKRVDPGYIELKFPDERRPQLRLETKSATDITKLSKDSPHGVMMCEAAQMNFMIYERARGRVTPMDGWMLLAGTLEQEMGAWFRELGMAWESGANDRKSFQLPSYTNVALYPGGRNDPKILAAEREQSDEWFLERIEGKPVPPRGLVFASEFRQDIHIQHQEYIPDLPIYVFEDPGYGSELSHAHAIEVFQLVADYLPNGQPYEQLRGIFEAYVHGKITADIIDSLMTQDWWKSPKFVYSDPWYKDQHHSMNSVSEVWLAKTGIVPGPDHRILVMPGIERMKSFLKVDPLTGKPRVTFDPSQKGIISEFGVGQNPLDGKYHPYRWKMDSDGVAYGQIPEQRYNDGISATICGLVGKFGYGFANPGQKRVARQQRW
jgi:hypothetical protein